MSPFIAEQKKVNKVELMSRILGTGVSQGYCQIIEIVYGTTKYESGAHRSFNVCSDILSLRDFVPKHICLALWRSSMKPMSWTDVVFYQSCGILRIEH